MTVAPTEIEHVLKLLAQTPGRIIVVSKGLNSDRLDAKAAAEAWSANDILAHLRACADVWGRSIAAMIEQDQPVLRYVSPRTWIRKTAYLQAEFFQSLSIFAEQRGKLLALLESLEANMWSRGATFTGTTRGHEQTVLSYAQRMAHHESEHCQQIEALLRSA